MSDHSCHSDALASRPSRRPDFALENQTLTDLSNELTNHPAAILQRLVEAVLECCGADSAGVSILRPSDDAVTSLWEVVAGALTSEVGRSLPVEACPVSAALDQDHVILLERPARCFAGVRDLDPPIREALVVPFHVGGEAAGGVWAVLQREDRQFEAEDARLLTSLSRFAATGYQLATALCTAETHREELERLVTERTRALTEANTELRRENRQRERAEQEQKKLATRLRDLAQELTAIEHRERKRLAALLHDNLQQLIAAAMIQVRQLNPPEGEPDHPARKAEDLLREADEASRELTQQLRPPVLYESGLLPALRELATQMQRRYHLRVEIDGPDRDPVQLDEDSRAFLFGGVRELLFNALKHAAVKDATVHVGQPSPENLRILVEDAGCGFDPTQPEFHHNASGFGLFSLKERVDSQGGHLAIDSAPGKGTRVVLEYPVAGPTGELTAPATLAAPSGHETGRNPGVRPGVCVLVVDDHAVVRQCIASTLDGDPRLTVVGEAHDGASALEAADRYRPDVITMDVNMPGMDGVEATRQIHQRWPEITIIGLSVQHDPTLADAMRQAGAVDLIAKTQDLAAVITAVMGTGAAAHDSVGDNDNAAPCSEPAASSDDGDLEEPA